MDRKLNPFEEDVRNYDKYELAEWIYRCKNIVTRPTKEAPVQEIETLPSRIEEVVSQWSEHRENNPDLYNSKKYHDALIGSNFKRPKITATFGKQKIDISELVYPDVMSFIGSLPTENAKQFNKILKDNYINTVDEYVQLVEDAFKKPENYKEYVELLLKHFFKDTEISMQFKELAPSTNLSQLTKEELIEILRIQPKPSSKEIIKYDGSMEKSSFVKKFEDYEVSKSTYYDWRGKERENKHQNYKAKEQRDFDKRFFTCLGLMLGLPFKEFEIFMKYNGYCIEGSTRKYDEYLSEAIKTGFSILYLQSIIDKANDELGAVRSEKKTGIPDVFRAAR